jgi:hypothetical protein
VEDDLARELDERDGDRRRVLACDHDARALEAHFAHDLDEAGHEVRLSNSGTRRAGILASGATLEELSGRLADLGQGLNGRSVAITVKFAFPSRKSRLLPDPV